VVDEANRNQPHEGWTYTHLEQGFVRGVMGDYDKETTPVVKGEDLVRLIALSGMLTRKAVASARL
jgi:hypothetical protein